MNMDTKARLHVLIQMCVRLKNSVFCPVKEELLKVSARETATNANGVRAI